MANFTNTTQSPVVEAVCFVHDSTATRAAYVFPYCLIIPMSLIGNSLVVAVVLKNKNMHKTVNLFIVNISIADLIATIVYMPRVISIWLAGYEWQVDGLAGLIFCKMAAFFNETSIAVSIFTVVAISFDRFLAVVFPLRHFITCKISIVIVVVIWISSLLITFPQYYGINLLRIGGKLYCYLSLDKIFSPGSATEYYTFKIVGLFAVPLVIITILYSAIMIALLKRRRFVGDATASDNARLQRQERTRKKVLKMVSIVVVVFVLCWLMYFINLVLYSYKVTVPCSVYYLRMLLAHLNSPINPLIYWFCNENFRHGYISLFHSLFPCVNGPNQVISLSKETGTNITTTRHDGNARPSRTALQH